MTRQKIDDEEVALTDRGRVYRVLNLNKLVAAVWLINGLFAKVLGAVPRHEQIVGEILGIEHASWLTIAIGIGEVLLAVWVLSGRFPRICATLQILLVATMNVIEFTLVPELLLWGKLNAIFALIFILVVFLNGFILPRRRSR